MSNEGTDINTDRNASILILSSDDRRRRRAASRAALSDRQLEHHGRDVLNVFTAVYYPTKPSAPVPHTTPNTPNVTPIAVSAGTFAIEDILGSSNSTLRSSARRPKLHNRTSTGMSSVISSSSLASPPSYSPGASSPPIDALSAPTTGTHVFPRSSSTPLTHGSAFMPIMIMPGKASVRSVSVPPFSTTPSDSRADHRTKAHRRKTLPPSIYEDPTLGP